MAKHLRDAPFELKCTPSDPLYAISDAACFLLSKCAPCVCWGRRIDVFHALSVIVPYFNRDLANAPVRDWTRLMTLAGVDNISTESAECMATISCTLGTGDLMVGVYVHIDEHGLLQCITFTDHRHDPG